MSEQSEPRPEAAHGPSDEEIQKLKDEGIIE